MQSKSSIIKNLQRSLAFYRVQYIQKDNNYYNQGDLDTIAVENIIGTGIFGHCYHGIGRIDKSNPIPILIKRLHDEISKDNALEYVIEMDALR